MLEITLPQLKIIKGNIDARLHSYIEHLLTYYVGRQKRHSECEEIQREDYPAKSTIKIIKDSLATPYAPALSCSLMMSTYYAAIPSIQNELAGLFHADEKALKRISILCGRYKFTSTTAQTVREYAISETHRYLKTHPRITSFLETVDLDFLSKSLTSSPTPSKPHT